MISFFPWWFSVHPNSLPDRNISKSRMAAICYLEWSRGDECCPVSSSVRMAQQTPGRRCIRAFISGFFVAVPVTVTVLDKLAYVARVEGASMQVRRDEQTCLLSHNEPSKTTLTSPSAGNT